MIRVVRYLILSVAGAVLLIWGLAPEPATAQSPDRGPPEDTGYRYLSKRDAAAKRDQGRRPDDRYQGGRPDDMDEPNGRDPREGMDTGARYGQVPVFKGESEAYQREMERQERLAAERSKAEAKAREMEESSWRGAPDRDRRKGRN